MHAWMSWIDFMHLEMIISISYTCHHQPCLIILNLFEHWHNVYHCRLSGSNSFSYVNSTNQCKLVFQTATRDCCSQEYWCTEMQTILDIQWRVGTWIDWSMTKLRAGWRRRTCHGLANRLVRHAMQAANLPLPLSKASCENMDACGSIRSFRDYSSSDCNYWFRPDVSCSHVL